MRRRPPMFWGAIITAMLCLLSACTTAGINSAIERSSAPLLVPRGDWLERFEFSAPPGSTDLYQVRWNFRPGMSDVVTGWQIAPTSKYDAPSLAEGPGQDLVDEALRAARGDGCVIAADDATLQLCTYDSEFARGGVNAYLVRLVHDQTLVIGYNNLGGNRTTYNPDALGAQFITAEFDPKPLGTMVDDHLVSSS